MRISGQHRFTAVENVFSSGATRLREDEFMWNKRQTEVHSALVEACKEEAVDRSTVTRWFQRLRDGDMSIEDKERMVGQFCY